MIFGSMQGISFLLYKLIYYFEIFYVLFGKLAVAFAIFLRFKNIKLFFPKPDQRGSYFKHEGNFSNTKIFFLYFLFSVRHKVNLTILFYELQLYKERRLLKQ